MADTTPDPSTAEAASPNQAHKQPAKRKGFSAFVAGCIVAAGWCCLVATLLVGLSVWLWWADLFTHFRSIYACVLLMAVPAAIWLKTWRQASFLMVGLTINLYLLAPLWTDTPGSGDPQAQVLEADATSTADSTIRVLQYNVLTSNRDHATSLAYLNQSGADILVLQEVNQAWIDALQNGLQSYDLLHPTPRHDNFGIVLAVKRDSPMQGMACNRLTNPDESGPGQRDPLPMIEAQFKVAGQTVHLLAIHPLPPVFKSGHDQRAQAFQFIKNWLPQTNGKDDTHTIVVGDLNATPWSQPFVTLIEQTNLRDSQRGFGFQGSFPARSFGPLMINIDHILTGPGILVTDRQVGPNLGSDHRPIWADLQILPAPGSGDSSPKAAD